MDAAPALVAAFLFAVAATLQQKGALELPKISLTDPTSLLKLIGQTMWLAGTIALLTEPATVSPLRSRPPATH